MTSWKPSALKVAHSSARPRPGSSRSSSGTLGHFCYGSRPQKVSTVSDIKVSSEPHVERGAVVFRVEHTPTGHSSRVSLRGFALVVVSPNGAVPAAIAGALAEYAREYPRRRREKFIELIELARKEREAMDQTERT